MQLLACAQKKTDGGPLHGVKSLRACDKKNEFPPTCHSHDADGKGEKVLSSRKREDSLVGPATPKGERSQCDLFPRAHVKEGASSGKGWRTCPKTETDLCQGPARVRRWAHADSRGSFTCDFKNFGTRSRA